MADEDGDYFFLTHGVYVISIVIIRSRPHAETQPFPHCSRLCARFQAACRLILSEAFGYLSRDRWFKYRPIHYYVTTLGKLLTPSLSSGAAGPLLKHSCYTLCHHCSQPIIDKKYLFDNSGNILVIKLSHQNICHNVTYDVTHDITYHKL